MQLKIIKPIVSFLFVFVMNNLVSAKHPSKMLLHHVSVLQDATTAVKDEHHVSAGM